LALAGAVRIWALPAVLVKVCSLPSGIHFGRLHHFDSFHSHLLLEGTIRQS